MNIYFYALEVCIIPPPIPLNLPQYFKCIMGRAPMVSTYNMHHLSSFPHREKFKIRQNDLSVMNCTAGYSQPRNDLTTDPENRLQNGSL